VNNFVSACNLKGAFQVDAFIRGIGNKKKKKKSHRDKLKFLKLPSALLRIIILGSVIIAEVEQIVENENKRRLESVMPQRSVRKTIICCKKKKEEKKVEWKIAPNVASADGAGQMMKQEGRVERE
jgi:hypothetical protein